MELRNGLIAVIPKRLGMYWLFLILGGCLIALLEYVYFQLPVIAEHLPNVQLTPLDVTNRNCILNWTISFFLLSAAAVSWTNFQLCLHFNDPMGKASVWFWASLAALFLSIDTYTEIHLTLRDLLIKLTGTPLYQDGSIWWLGLYVFFFGLVGLRLLIHFLPTVISLFLFVLSAIGIIIGQLVDFGIITIPLEGDREQIMLRTGITAVSALFFTLSTVLFARRLAFRDPETALRWTVQVWNHSPLLQMFEEQKQKEKQENKPPAPLVSKPPEKSADKASQRPTVKPVTEKPVQPKSNDFDLTK